MKMLKYLIGCLLLSGAMSGGRWNIRSHDKLLSHTLSLAILLILNLQYIVYSIYSIYIYIYIYTYNKLLSRTLSLATLLTEKEYMREYVVCIYSIYTQKEYVYSIYTQKEYIYSIYTQKEYIGEYSVYIYIYIYIESVMSVCLRACSSAFVSVCACINTYIHK